MDGQGDCWAAKLDLRTAGHLVVSKVLRRAAARAVRTGVLWAATLALLRVERSAGKWVAARARKKVDHSAAMRVWLLVGQTACSVAARWDTSMVVWSAWRWDVIEVDSRAGRWVAH